ncbi:MAG TPA: DegT/DnrJ/EryC1/StrS family aminotransferase [Vicinamibacterales bacterium]|nr:DegT/DnrJ/EryC1/StrS family aminotransferase [Vicinamibacterales bacterium]
MQTSETTTRIPFVDLKAQYDSIKTEVDAAIASVITQTAFIGGSFLKEFEEAFARYCGTDLCVGMANGTDALYIALRALGVGPGDEVITAANSFIATSEAIKMAGAQVVFCDCDPVTYNIDVTKIEAKITPKTKAIIPVHLYGQPADMDPILALAKKHNLRVVGDAAQAHGATYKGRPIAALADITCYSFYPGKNLGAYGDGGALVTNNAEWAATARMIANHGRTKKYDHDFEGVNSRLDGIQAAILSVKLRYIERWTENRRKNAYLYNAALKGKGVGTPEELKDLRAVYHLYIVRVPAERREQFQASLKAAGIDTGIHYPIALPYLNAYRHLGHSESDFPHALEASREIVSLPMFPELTEDQIRYVADRVQEFMGAKSVR